jgi:hypothetical protein
MCVTPPINFKSLNVREETKAACLAFKARDSTNIKK